MSCAVVGRPHVREHERAGTRGTRELACLGCGHVRCGVLVLLGQGRLGEEQVGARGGVVDGSARPGVGGVDEPCAIALGDQRKGGIGVLDGHRCHAQAAQLDRDAVRQLDRDERLLELGGTSAESSAFMRSNSPAGR